MFQTARLRPERICIIKPSALGDVVQALPVVDGLRQRFPSASISWVINSELADLVTGHSGLSEVVCFARRGGWLEQLRLLRTLRERRFDLVLDLQGLFRTALMTAATSAPWRIGLETAREGAIFACRWTVPRTGRAVPAYQRYWNVVEWLGGSGDRPAPRLHIPADARRFVEATLGPLRVGGRPLLAIHPGAKWETKRWPAPRFAEVARRIAGDVSIVLVGSAADRPAADEIVSAVVAKGGRALNLAGRTTLKQLAALLQQIDVLLSNDSGPMHLAAELGTPVVGMFTCTSSRLSGPPPGRHVLIDAAVSCAAGYHKTCPHRGPANLACFDAIDVERVIRAVTQVLHGGVPATRAA